MAVYMVNILLLFTGLILSECFIAQAQSTVSGEFHPECDNMLECQYEIRQLYKKVDNLESHMKTMLELLDSRTNDILTELSEIKVLGPQCNATGFEFNGINYEFMTLPKHWQAARDDCSTRGGDLVSMATTEEWVFLHDLIYQHDYNNQCARFWTSGEKRGDNWVWANGNKEIDPPWPQNEPSSDGSCLNLIGQHDYRINDAPCSGKDCYIWEYQ